MQTIIVSLGRRERSKSNSYNQSSGMDCRGHEPRHGEVEMELGLYRRLMWVDSMMLMGGIYQVCILEVGHVMVKERQSKRISCVGGTNRAMETGDEVGLDS